MTQSCWQCGAPPKAATSSDSSRPLLDDIDVHHLLTSNDVPLDSQIASIHNFISDGQNQLENLEATIAQLTRKRDEIAENVRQHRAIFSRFYRVPPELVCEILALSLSSDDETTANRPPWHLGHICRSWRRAVLAYPALWSSIIIPLPLLPRTITPGFPCSKPNLSDPPVHHCSVFVGRQTEAEQLTLTR
jgi:hypothetical protein